MLSFRVRMFKFAFDFLKCILQESNIHGFKHLASDNRNPVEKLMWLFTILLSSFFVYKLGTSTITKYYENPTSISLERDMLSKNTTFPSITVCPIEKFNEKLLNEYIRSSQYKNKTTLKEFLVALFNANYENFESVPLYDEVSKDDYMDILEQLKYVFTSTFKIEGRGGQITADISILEMGICYSVKSILAIYNSPEYRKSNRQDIVEDETLFVNELDGDVIGYVGNFTGCKIYFHDPYEVPDIATKYNLIPNKYISTIALSALEIYSTKKVRSLSVEQRKCRFYDDANLKRYPIYSYVLCRMECRASLSKRLCGCIPHFYKKIGDDRICNVSGLHCLAKYKERLIGVKNECFCLPNCNETRYVVKSMRMSKWFLGSNIIYHLMYYPKTRLRRYVLFDFGDVLIYLGGLAGLCLGCSVISFVEILYFFTFRLVKFIYIYKNK